MRDKDGSPIPQDVTNLLRLASEGDKAAVAELFQAIERELHKLASIHMRRERANHTLQTTALVNEAFIRLMGSRSRQWNERTSLTRCTAWPTCSLLHDSV